MQNSEYLYSAVTITTPVHHKSNNFVLSVHLCIVLLKLIGVPVGEVSRCACVHFTE